MTQILSKLTKTTPKSLRKLQSLLTGMAENSTTDIRVLFYFHFQIRSLCMIKAFTMQEDEFMNEALKQRAALNVK